MYVSDISYWWIFPLAMIALCFSIMRGRKGSMICGFGSREQDDHRINTSDSASETVYFLNSKEGAIK